MLERTFGCYLRNRRALSNFIGWLRKVKRREPNVPKTAAVLLLFLVVVCGARAGDDGELTYKAQCQKCHGTKGEGSTDPAMKIKPENLTSASVQKKTDEELYKSIAYGVGHKEYAHAFAERGLSAKQIAELVTYIRSFAEVRKKSK